MQRKRALIIDGYNVIRNNDCYQVEDQEDYSSEDIWNKARQSLINDAGLHANQNYERCCVVFDGAGNEASVGKPKIIAGVEVIFSPYKVSADSVIERLAHDMREDGFEVVVVSSDAAIQSTVFGGGVRRMSALGFGSASEIDKQELREQKRQVNTHSSNIASRINPDVAKKLHDFVRGNGQL